MADLEMIRRMNPEMGQWCIYLGYRGSQSHGTYVPSTNPDSIDDIDLHGLYVLPEEYYFGLKSHDNKTIKIDEWDIVMYEARVGIKLLAQGNPNMLVMLFAEDKHNLKTSDAYEILRNDRQLFLSKDMYMRFRGYAKGQFHKMTHPSNDEKSQAYMGAKRKSLVEQFGYDCKNASHTIRILTMGIEALNLAYLYVDRTGRDAVMLMDVKTGKWTLDQVNEYADYLFRTLDEAYEHSVLPDHVDMDRLSKLCTRAVKAGLRF